MTGRWTRLVVLALALGASACAPAEVPGENRGNDPGPMGEALVARDLTKDRCDDGSGERLVYLVRALSPSREEPVGVANGFDLDGHATEGSGAMTGCGRADFVAPDGREGIDNQFARLLPTLEELGGQAFSTLVQAAINEGDLLILIELEDVDDMEFDGCVNLNIMYGVGAPFVGRDEIIEPWQTFDVDVEQPWARAEGVRLEGGRVEAGPFDLRIPFVVFDYLFPIDVQGMQVRFDLDSEASGAGVLGGGLTIENMMLVAEQIEGGEQFPPLIERIGGRMADLQKNEEGACEAMSVAMDFELIGAFIYPDSPRF